MSPAPSPAMTPVASLRREVIYTLAAAGVVVLFGGALLLWDPGYFWIDDSQSGAMPAYCEMARAWRSGEIPLLNRSSWRAGAPGCEYPAGVFSPSLAGCILLVFGLDMPLPLAAATISILHLAVLSAGAFRLARQRGLTVDLAMLVALVASLNGWIILWGCAAGASACSASPGCPGRGGVWSTHGKRGTVGSGSCRRACSSSCLSRRAGRSRSSWPAS